MKKIVKLALVLFTALCTYAGAQTYTLYDPSYVYTKDNDGNLSWLATIDAGTKFDGSRNSLVPEKINKVANSKKLEFTNVNYKGKDAWILKSGLIDSRGEKNLDSVAVTTKDALVFTWDNTAAFENFLLPAGTVVITDNSKCKNDSLVKIWFYDNQVFWKIRSAYVYKNSVSTSTKDYDAVILTKTALKKDAAKEAEIIAKLLSSAEDKAEDHNVRQFVKDAIASMEKADISNSSIVDFVGKASVSSNGSKVNVRDVPGTKGKVVGQLADGVPLAIYQKTEQKDTVGGESDHWYHITTPGEDSVDGWVFGSAITLE